MWRPVEETVANTGFDAVIDKEAVSVDDRIGLGDCKAVFLVCGEVDDVVGDTGANGNAAPGLLRLVGDCAGDLVASLRDCFATIVQQVFTKELTDEERIVCGEGADDAAIGCLNEPEVVEAAVVGE